MLKLYEENYIKQIADAIRSKLSTSAKYKISQMPQAIMSIQGSGQGDPSTPDQPSDNYFDIPSSPISIKNHLDSNGNWVRPREYENLDLINIGTDQVAYYSYYKTTEDVWAVGFRISCLNGARIEFGHISSNGTFTVYKTEEVTHNQYYQSLLREQDNTCVIRITPIQGNITGIKFARISKELVNKSIDIYSYQQACVERIGYLPYVNDFTSQGSSYSYGCWRLEHDKLNSGQSAVVNSLSNAWQYCYSLQKLDMSGWNTKNWNITTLFSCFFDCMALKNIDLSSWDTTNWKTTSLQGMFGNCYNLTNVNVEKLNTTNWVVTNTSSMFSNCINLKSLDLSKWVTTNWKVTSMGSMFLNCNSLQGLNLSSLETKNWKVTNMATAFDNLFNCREIHMFKNTQNFTAYTAPKNCYLLTVYEPQNYIPPTNLDFSTNTSLGSTSILAILNALPTVTNQSVITLGSLRSKVSSAELIVAIQKGWTIA